MDGFTLQLEVLTPLFMGGAGNQLQSQGDAFRILSLRGLTRFWFRALMGGVIGNGPNNLTRVRQAESEVFGSTERASAIQFRLLNSPRYSKYQLSRRVGVGYLGFSLGRDEGVGALSPGERVEIAIEGRPGAGNTQSELLLALGALWLLANLGGLGSRSRRGFGSVVVTSVKPFDGQSLPSFQMPDRGRGPGDLASFLSEGLEKLRNLYSGYLGQSPVGATRAWEGTTLPEYDILARGAARIKVASVTFPHWEEVLDHLGRRLKQARGMYARPRRQTFGLPMPSRRDVRRASPLLFKVVRFPSGRYGAVLTLFKATFLPSNIKDGWDYTILDKFLDDNDGPEVKLP